jgi:hypothetical protein
MARQLGQLPYMGGKSGQPPYMGGQIGKPPYMGGLSRFAILMQEHRHQQLKRPGGGKISTQHAYLNCF